MSGVVRPETALYEPGISVATKFAEDGGQEFAGERIRGIVLGVEDAKDVETGEVLGRVFRVLDWRSCTGNRPELKVHMLSEATLDLDGAHITDGRGLRMMRRRLHRFIHVRSYRRNGAVPATDSTELEAEACIRVLLGVEVR